MTSPSPDAPGALLAEGRALASAGAWRELRALLAANAGDAARAPALVLLHAESMLRTGDAHAAGAWLAAHEGSVVLSGDRAAARRAANLRGAAQFELGQLDDAAAAFARALELARADGDDLLVARATNNLALIANIRGRHAEALGLYAVALPAYQRLGNANGIAESHHNMAITYRDLGQLDDAEEHERRAAEFARMAENERLVAIALVGRAELSFRRGDAAFAEATAVRAAREFEAVPDPARQADALRLCGAARLVLRKLRPARESLDAAVQLASAHGSALIEAESRRARAELAAATGALAEALADARRAASIFERLHATAEHAATLEWIARQPGATTA